MYSFWCLDTYTHGNIAGEVWTQALDPHARSNIHAGICNIIVGGQIHAPAEIFLRVSGSRQRPLYCFWSPDLRTRGNIPAGVWIYAVARTNPYIVF
jgi:hypothetical protein